MKKKTLRMVRSSQNAAGHTVQLRFRLSEKITYKWVFLFIVVVFLFTTGTSINMQAQTNNALTFDGTDDYVDLPDLSTSYDFSQGITFTAWVKWNSFSTNARLFDFSNADNSIANNIDLYVNSSQCLVLEDANSGNTTTNIISTTTTVTTGKWYHIAATISSTGEGKIYIDGNVVASGTINAITNTQRVNNYLGKSAWNSYDGYFSGVMDEVSVWDTVLAQPGIVGGMVNGFTGSESNMVAYYKFNQGTANGTNTGITALADSSANALNGTLTNFALSGTSSNWVSGYDDSNTVYSLSASVSGLSFGKATGGTGTFTIASNIAWTITGAPNWISISPASGTGDAAVTLTTTDEIVADHTDTLVITGHNAANDTVVITREGNHENALAFDGADDYVDLPNLTTTYDFSKGLTFIAWVKWNSFPSNARLFDFSNAANSANDNIDLYVNSSHCLVLEDANSGNTTTNSISSTTIVTTGKWYHVATTISSTGAGKIYINGNLVASGKINAITNTQRVNNYLGKSAYDSYDGYFSGAMDEVSVWDTVLTQQVIIESIAGNFTGSESNLVACYRFNQGNAGGTNTSITILADSSANALNGTLTNFALSGTSSNWVSGFDNSNITYSISASVSSLSFDYWPGSTGTFAVTSNTDWTVSGLPTWLSLSAASGTGNDTLTVTTIAENLSGADRYDTLVISGAGVANDSIIVKQLQYSIIASPSEVCVKNAAGSTGTFTIASNTGWAVTGVPDWISASPASGTGDVTVTLTTVNDYTANTDLTDTLVIAGNNVANDTVVITREGLHENALAFDGSNDYVDLPDLTTTYDFSQGLTFTAWVKWDAFNSNAPLFDFSNTADTINDNIGLYVNSSHCIVLAAANSSNSALSTVTTAIPVSTATWYHVAVIISSAGEGNIYLNGILVASGALNAITNTTRANNYLGKSYSSGDGYFSGAMDEVTVWEKALSETEITEGKVNGFTANESSLVACYRFNQGNAGGANTGVTTLADSSANALNGTLTNFALTGTTGNFVAGYDSSGTTVPVYVSASAVTMDNLLGSAATLVVVSNTSWTVSETSGWFDADVTSGQNIDTITLTVTATHTNLVSRSDTLTIATGTGHIAVVELNPPTRIAFKITRSFLYISNY